MIVVIQGALRVAPAGGGGRSFVAPSGSLLVNEAVLEVVGDLLGNDDKWQEHDSWQGARSLMVVTGQAMAAVAPTVIASIDLAALATDALDWASKLWSQHVKGQALKEVRIYSS
jgi:hypothetical protein